MGFSSYILPLLDPFRHSAVKMLLQFTFHGRTRSFWITHLGSSIRPIPVFALSYTTDREVISEELKQGHI